MIVRTLSVLLTTALAGCAPRDAATSGGVIARCPGTSAPLASLSPAGSGCGLVCRAELPVTVTAGGSPLVDVWVDDAPARLLLDTGAARSALLRGAAARLGLGAPVERSGMVTGIGGAQNRATVPVRSIAFGHIRLGPIPVDVISMGRLSDKTKLGDGSSGEAFDGVLGADVFGRYQLDLDLPHGVARLYEGRLCMGLLPGWAHDDGAVPFVPWVHSGHTIVDAKLDGQPVTAMLDSGAETIVVGLDTAHAHGATDLEMNSEFGVRLVGVGPALVPGRLHRFASLAVGPETTALPETDVAPLGFRGLDMVVGMSFLESHKIWIDYAARMVHFAHDW